MSEPKHAATPQPIAWFTPQRRRWTYRIGAAVIALLIAYGALDSAKAPLWLALIGTILGAGAVDMHIPTGGDS